MMLTVPKATVVVTTVPLTKAVVRQLRFVKNYEQSREHR